MFRLSIPCTRRVKSLNGSSINKRHYIIEKENLAKYADPSSPIIVDNKHRNPSKIIILSKIDRSYLEYLQFEYSSYVKETRGKY